MLCDAHLHFIPEELAGHTSFYKGVWTDKGKLYAFLDAQGIERALLVYPSTDAHLKLGGYARVCHMYNASCLSLAKENKKIIPSAIVDIENLTDITSCVAALRQDGFRAISLASSYAGRFIIKELIPLFEAVEKYGLAIFVHPQTINPIGFDRVNDPLLMPVLEYSFDSSMFMGLLMMEGVLEKFDIPFIFSSLGGVMPFLKERFDRVYGMLRARSIVKDLGKNPSEVLKKVYVDTSSASLVHIRLAIELFGEDKILWGSDYPVAGDVTASIAMFDALDPALKEKITGSNFLKLFG
ncbi:MAG: amidohydrolase family protein [Candidatus Omnitrophota bacterium]